jgi:hypothetical protein
MKFILIVIVFVVSNIGVSVLGNLIHPDIHPILKKIHKYNNLKRKHVRFGSDYVDVNSDLFDENGDSLLHHHHRRLGSLIHETVQSRLIYLPETWPLAEVGEVIEFELFDGMVVVGRTDHVMARNEESVGWSGDIRISTGDLEADLMVSDGYFGLSCLAKSCAANIQIYSTDQEFHIAPSGIPLEEDGGGVYMISEVTLDPARQTGVTGKHAVHSTGNSSMHVNRVRGSLRGSDSSGPFISPSAVANDHIVDILALYTPESVATYAGGR